MNGSIAPMTHTGFKYLHAAGSNEGTYWVDHRIVPEIRGMLAAQVSRAPLGGVRARYKQVVEAVARSMYEDARDARPNKQDFWPEWNECQGKSNYECWTRDAEERLCTYPLHPKVQKFFDDFVGKYGHSSILELVGGVPIFSETLSWLSAWISFDSPLCSGQEFSTRAVQHKDWPMAKECYVTESTLYEDCTITQTTDYGNSDVVKVEDVSFLFGGTTPVEPKKLDVQVHVIKPHPDLKALHDDWFEVFEAEVKWWTEHFSLEANRLVLGIADKEPFRPALDRARWALPGTIATGVAHTSNLRERSRVIRDGSLLAQMSKCPSAEAVWSDMATAYKEALPGLTGMGLREAVYGADSPIPGHLKSLFTDAPDGPDAEVDCTYTDGLSDVAPFKRAGEKSYADPLANTLFRVGLAFRCSLAVARDWHRHRTCYPWHLQVVRGDGTLDDLITRATSKGLIQIDHHYEPKSDLAKLKVPELLQRSTRIFDAFMTVGNIVQAGLALPLGTRVRMRGQGGLRDAVYLLHLRYGAVGANFEYKEQARLALDLLSPKISDEFGEALGLNVL